MKYSYVVPDIDKSLGCGMSHAVSLAVFHHWSPYNIPGQAVWDM